MRFAGTLEVTTPSDDSIEMVRRFDAPRRLVFAALTEPALLRRWHGADGWNLEICEVDLRVGGAWRFVSRGPDGSTLGHGGVYRDVRAPSRLEYTETFDDRWYAGEALVTVTLSETAGVTTVRTLIRYESRAVRDHVLRSPMRRGVTEGFDRLSVMLPETGGSSPMNWTLEVVVVPVADLERAKRFYAEQLGFAVDHDTGGPGFRIVQLTPPGSGCSVVIGEGMGVDMPPGSLKGLQLVVNDLEAARAQLVERGVEVSEITVFGENGPRPRRDGDDLNNVGFVYFDDPDGNSWAVQQITARP